MEASIWPMCWCRDGKIEAAEEDPSVWRPFCASWKSWGSIVRTRGSTEGLEPGSTIGFMSFERWFLALENGRGKSSSRELLGSCQALGSF